MRSFLAALMSAAFALIATSEAQEPKQPKEPKLFCPVAGVTKEKGECCCPNDYCPKFVRKGNDKVAVEHQGHKVFVCCRGCIDVFKKDSAKFTATANHQLAMRGLAKQVKCPLCGGATEEKHKLDVLGVTVGLCSEECKKKAEKAAVKERLEQLFGKKAFASGFAVVEVKK